MTDTQNPFNDCASEDDNPLPPPASVSEAIPPFHLHGERECGDHQHDASNSNFAKYLQRQGKDKSTAWNVACCNCHARVTLNQLHDLPCGDLICRDCVLVKVFSVKLKTEQNREKIQEARAKMGDIDRLFYHARDMTLRQKKEHIRRHEKLQQSVLRLAGFTCCGVYMELDRFLSCLNPDLSRDLWLAIEWVHDSLAEQRACAWPDCGAYLPVCCKYSRPGDSARRWHCVACQGNSMECARTLRTSQTKFPCLPKGQPALTPSR
ncbi:hypothetical protein C8A01DRAFT_15520 [Parachaetomium inaequale]|uniref:Uncharacterized protein n=1 Tax=Parachaetomium inaequale TaxID=2588326 RepID=A0AAN6PH97_9PEZI|nr:hypothetical protein C8A01DRAFT_15520 [Parachaetomium inaequale]